MDNNPTPKGYVVRVFLSSTFRDMQTERDELAKVIFPELRSFCRERGVELVEVDLRWGITEEQAQHGETLRLCLEEINRCRPYFIGLLGERYGWIPDEIQASVKEEYYWISEQQGKSVTELEILHGVLNNPEMANRARFYFRDPAYAAGCGSDFISESNQASQKLADLKQRIRASGFPVVEGYPDPQTVAKRIGEDLRAAIEEEYPIKEKSDPLLRQAEDHAFFAQSMQQSYIERLEYTAVLDHFVLEESNFEIKYPALLVTGEAGCGKSTLLANWANHYIQAHPDDFLLMHFIGHIEDSGDYINILKRILSEVNKPHGNLYIGQLANDWIKDFPQFFNSAAVKFYRNNQSRRAIIVLDGLDKLENRDHALELFWLPEIFPGNVRFIVSASSGRSYEAIKRRPHKLMYIEPLTRPERRALIETYLGRYRKKLDTALLERIADAKAGSSPLYLHVLTEELRLFGEHEKLSERIGFYLQAETVQTLYQKVLERLEQDYDPARRGLWNPSPDHDASMVREALSVLWASRRGLEEHYLLKLIGSPPRVAWSFLYLALEYSLVQHRGILKFANEYLRQSVQKRWLPDPQSQHALRLKVAEFFTDQLSKNVNVFPDSDIVLLDEIAWQWMMCGEWSRLYNLLGDPENFNKLWILSKNEFGVKEYWAAVETNSDFRKAVAYQKVLDSPGNYSSSIVQGMANLFSDTGCHHEALKLRNYLLETARNINNDRGYTLALINQAVSYKYLGDPEKALALLQQQEQICRQSGYPDLLVGCLNNQSWILQERGDTQGALKLLEEAEKISSDDLTRSIILGNQANLLLDLGDLEKATRLFKEQEYLARKLGDLNILQAALGNQASLLHKFGDIDGSQILFEEQERLCRQSGNLEGLLASLGNQANIHKSRGDLDGTLVYYTEMEQIYRTQENWKGLQRILFDHAQILFDRREFDKALNLYQELERLCRQPEEMEGEIKAIGNQALVLFNQDKKPEGLTVSKRAVELAQKSGNEGLIEWTKLIYLQVKVGMNPLSKMIRRFTGR